MKPATALVFIIQGYSHEEPTTSTLFDLTTIELVEDTAEKALERAKALIEKPHYRVSKIIETFVKQ